MKKILAVFAVFILASCGGGGGGGGGSPPPPTAITGVAVDGYIEGATVCLDLNLNQACDASEPSATTAAGGTFTLSISGLTTAQVRAAHILIKVPSSAKDSDDAGQTLAQAGKSAFTLMAPTGAFVSEDGTSISSAIVSPLTTLVSHDMIVGNGKPLADAQTSVRTRLNLPSSTDLHQNFIANNNTALHNRAIAIAHLIGKAFDGAKLVGSTNDREALFAALTYLQNNVSVVQRVVDADSSNAAIRAKVDAAFVLAGIAPNYENLIAEARVTTTVSSAAISTILNNVAYAASCLLESSCSYFSYMRVAGQSGQSGQSTFAYYTLTGTNWASIVPGSNQSYLGSNGWASYQYSSTGTYTIVNPNLALAQGPANGQTYLSTVMQLDLAGKTVADIPGAWSKENLKAITFPVGSILYLPRLTSVADYYTLSSDRPLTCIPSGSCNQNTFASIDDLISAHLTAGTSGVSNHLSWLDLDLTFDTPNATTTGGTVTLWKNSRVTCTKRINGYSCLGSGPSTYSKIGSAPYEIRTVNGERILLILTPSNWDQGRNPIYSMRAGVMYTGKFSPAGMTDTSSLYFNRTAMDALVAAWGKSAIPN
ncbi:hypothetical protein [Limnohabitans sp. B9-3]|uniref:hypothetical protein n=1 Tax=Limnohabitans sp. B9-3 TaxID=1100707 RepID=UPI00117A3496|nr:hypothetical protein [Limnohabitans sp. B9-3]